MIITVRSAPSTRVSSTSASASRILPESSRMIVREMSLGSCSMRSSTTTRTCSATSTVLEPVILSTSRESAGSPPIIEAVRFSAVPSTTFPTSRTRMGAPFRTTTVTSPKASGSVMRPVMRTRRSESPRWMRPAGTSWFSRWSAATTCAGETP